VPWQSEDERRFCSVCPLWEQFNLKKLLFAVIAKSKPSPIPVIAWAAQYKQ
jgi:hypothetical protein